MIMKKAQANLCANMKEMLNNPKTLASIISAGCGMTRTDARKFFDDTTDGMNLR